MSETSHPSVDHTLHATLTFSTLILCAYMFSLSDRSTKREGHCDTAVRTQYILPVTSPVSHLTQTSFTTHSERVGRWSHLRLKELGVLRKRQSMKQELRTRQQESQTPLRGQANRWISHKWQRLGRYQDVRLRRELTRAMTMMDQAAWDSSVMPIPTGTDADGMSIAVVAGTTEHSAWPSSTGVSTELRASTRALDDDGARSSRTETGEAQSISVEDSSGIVRSEPRADILHGKTVSDMRLPQLVSTVAVVPGKQGGT